MDKRQWRRLLIGDFSFKRLLRSVAFVYISFAVIIFFAADQIMFYPDFPSRSRIAGGVWLRTSDGELVSAVHRPTHSTGYTLLISHGNAESLPEMEYLFSRLNELGFSVFGYDYRGYGLSEGKPTEKNTYEDIDAAYAHLTQELGVAPNRVIAYGRSIGGGPSTDLAAREPIAGLILESTFTSAFRVRTRIPILPFDKFRNLSKLDRVRCPVLVMHSADDEIIPIWHGEALFDRAAEPKRALWVEEGGHGGIPFTHPDEYGKALRGFLEILESQRADERSDVMPRM